MTPEEVRGGLDGERLLRPGNTNCGGCGMSIALNMLGGVIGDRPVQLVIPACCGIVTAGQFPFSAYGVPVVASTFASAAAVATGLSQVARLNGEPTRVICWAGDGGTYDIGMATLSAAAERDEDILYICYDNEIYGNTGGQRSSATPQGASTTTTREGKPEAKKDIMSIMAAHRVPYAATISLAHPQDMLRKMEHALEVSGLRFLHILSPCPTGWKSDPAQGVELVRLAVRSGLYPVYEVLDGEHTFINVLPEMSRESLESYFSRQGRFRKSAIPVKQIETAIARHWDHLHWLSHREHVRTARGGADGWRLGSPPRGASSVAGVTAGKDSCPHCRSGEGFQGARMEADQRPW